MREAREITFPEPPYQLCTVDVGTSFSKAGELILELLNNREVNYHGRCIDRTSNVTLSINHTLIFTFIPYEMTRFIASLLLLKDIDTTLMAITTQSIYPTELLQKDTFIFSFEASFEIEVQRGAVQRLKDKAWLWST